MGLSVPNLFPLSVPADEEPLFPIVDTHTHFYDPTRAQGIPWPSKDDSVLYRPVLPREFKQLTEPLGVTGTVIVEASPWLEDNQWLLDLAANDPFIKGIVGNLTLGMDSFPSQLAQFAKNPKYRGIRVSSDVLARGLEKPEFRADLKKLIDADLELDVNGGPSMLQVVSRLADHLPDLRIVINHLANPRIDGKDPSKEWVAGLAAAARHERVWLKVSALVENARVDGKKFSEEPSFYRPTLRAAYTAFGEDRLMYGSNWPVADIAAPYRVVFKIVSEFFRELGREASKKFFADNAQVAYRWVERATE